MIPGTRTAEGNLVISTASPAAPTTTRSGGIAVANTGEVFVTSVLPAQAYPNGFATRADGALCIAYGGPIAGHQQGLPFTADGRLVCQLNQPPSQGDAYVGGIRVGPLGGVYVTDVSPPPPRGFSPGYNEGF